MSQQINGIMQVTTKGWKFSKLGNLIALLPITVTFLLSVLALILPWALKHHALTRLPQNSVAEHIVFYPASIVSLVRASAAGGVSHFFQGLRHASDSAIDRDAHFLSIGLTRDNKIGFVESETPQASFGAPGKNTSSSGRNLGETTRGPSRPTNIDTSTSSAIPAVHVKEDDYPDLEKTG